jgi:transposase-like protein
MLNSNTSCGARPNKCQESLRALAKRYGINPKTVAKWKKRETVADLPTGPKEAKSTVLSIEDEAIIVAFRRHTLLPLALSQQDWIEARKQRLWSLAIRCRSGGWR